MIGCGNLAAAADRCGGDGCGGRDCGLFVGGSDCGGVGDED